MARLSIGDIVKDRLVEAGADGLVIADLFKDMAAKEKKQTHATYCSFARYFWLFKKLGFVSEIPNSRENAWNPKLQQRRLFRLTPTGRSAPIHEWSNPMRTLYDQVYGEGAWVEYMRRYREPRRTGRPVGRPPKISWEAQ